MLNINFGKLQRTIYKFTIARMKLPADIQQDAQFTAQETDTFWNDSFDELYNYLQDRSIYFGEVLDALQDSVCSTSEQIAEWYTNPWNHPPGYVSPKIEALDDVPESALKKLIEEAVPGITKIANEMEKERKKKDTAEAKELAQSLKPEVPAVVKLVKENDAAGWDYFWKYMHKDKHFVSELEYIYGSKQAAARVLKTTSGRGLKRTSAKILKPAAFQQMTLENVYYNKGKSKDPVYSTLDKALWNKYLRAMVMKELAKS